TQRALNLYKGRFGDIDLHLYPFHPHQGHHRDDERFWADATRTKLDQIPVCVPSPAQQVAIAIAHGGLDSHTHSDWLCDIADLLSADTVAADELETIIEARGIEASAAIALHYLADECELPVERAMLDRVTRRASAKPLRYLSQFLQTRPRDREGQIGRIMRGMAKQVRMRAARKALPRLPSNTKIAVRAYPRSGDKPGNEPVLLQYNESIQAIDGRLRLKARIELSAQARRPCDFEVFADDQFIGHASWRANLYRKATLNLAFEFEKPTSAKILSLVARPRRADRLIETAADMKRYAAVPFRILDFSVKPY
ncbi:MAG: nucleotidyltransferase family protein, partial [Pseudomonadota bacterium]